MPNDTTTTVEVAPTPQVTVTPEVDVWTPSVLLAFAVAITGLLGWLFRVHHKLINALRDITDVGNSAASNKQRIEVLERHDTGKEVRLVKLEADVTHIREAMDRSENKLDRMLDLMTLGKK